MTPIEDATFQGRRPRKPLTVSISGVSASPTPTQPPSSPKRSHRRTSSIPVPMASLQPRSRTPPPPFPPSPLEDSTPKAPGIHASNTDPLLHSPFYFPNPPQSISFPSHSYPEGQDAYSSLLDNSCTFPALRVDIDDIDDDDDDDDDDTLLPVEIDRNPILLARFNSGQTLGRISPTHTLASFTEVHPTIECSAQAPASPTTAHPPSPRHRRGSLSASGILAPFSTPSAQLIPSSPSSYGSPTRVPTLLSLSPSSPAATGFSPLPPSPHRRSGIVIPSPSSARSSRSPQSVDYTSRSPRSPDSIGSPLRRSLALKPFLAPSTSSNTPTSSIQGYPFPSQHPGHHPPGSDEDEDEEDGYSDSGEVVVIGSYTSILTRALNRVSLHAGPGPMITIPVSGPVVIDPFGERSRRSRKKLDSFFGEVTPLDVSIHDIDRHGLRALLAQGRLPLCYLLRFLLEEYACENLFFFLEVQHFESYDFASRLEASAAAQQIIDTYISPTSPYEVNLSERTRLATLDLARAGDVRSLRRAFAAPKAAVLQLLEDSFSRFLPSAWGLRMRADLSADGRRIYTSPEETRAVGLLLGWLHGKGEGAWTGGLGQREMMTRELVAEFCRSKFAIAWDENGQLAPKPQKHLPRQLGVDSGIIGRVGSIRRPDADPSSPSPSPSRLKPSMVVRFKKSMDALTRR